MTHHCSHSLDILGFEHIFKIVKLIYKKIHLLKKHILILNEELAPHKVVYSCNSRKVTEGVTRKFLHILLIVAGHKRNSNTVRKL